MVRWLMLPCVALLACGRKDVPAPQPGPKVAAGTPASARPTTAIPTSAAPPPAPAPAPTSVKVELEGDGGLPGLRLGELFDLGPAGPATASASGVVLLTKKDQLLEARLTG